MRLPAFGFLVLALGEWLPLVVMYITPLIPEACRIPQQVQRSLRKLEDKRQKRLQSVSRNAMSLMSQDRRPVGTDTISMQDGKIISTMSLDWRSMTLYELSIVAAQQDCYPSLFDWVPITPPKWWLQRNVRKKLDYLRTDDRLIERDGGWAALGREEVLRACVERGIPVFGKREDATRKDLALLWRSGGKTLNEAAGR
jgi:hypothetical protein